MSDTKRDRLCTVDHAGKQLDAIGWSDHRFWLEFARRRRREREAARRAEREPANPRGEPAD